MKQRFFTALALAALTFGAVGAANATDWELDNTHSTVSFTVTHMLVSEVGGGFDKFSGSATFDADNLAAGSAEVTIDVASIDTDNDKRDSHLKSGDFFDAEKFPTITFKSAKLTAGADGAITLAGQLTMKGVTKDVTFSGKVLGVMDGKRGKRVGFKLSTTINREDFTVDWNRPLDGGGLVVSKDVEIVAQLTFVEVKKEEATDSDNAK